MLSVRIVSADSYMSAPIPGLDVTYSEFRASEIELVPVIRLFGSTPQGVKTCVHVHGVFPYICIPYDSGEPHTKLAYQIAVSLDKAINISLGSSNSQTKHVHKIVLVSGVPFYGYHGKEHQFLKIYFYKPNITKKAVSLLENGAVLNRVFQPHEAHVAFMLQFFIDFNLRGMDYVHFARARYRRTGSSAMDNIPQELWLAEAVKPLSVSQLEADVVSRDIMNPTIQQADSGVVNPGLAAIWNDEKQRRLEDGVTETPRLHSQRPLLPPTNSDLYYRQKITAKLESLQESSDSLSSESLSGSRLSYPNETPAGSNILEASFVNVHSGQMGRPEKETNQEPHLDESVVDEEVVRNLNSSQMSQRLNYSQLDEEDMELLMVMEGLANHNTQTVDANSVLGSQLSEPGEENQEKVEAQVDEDDGENWLDRTLVSDVVETENRPETPLVEEDKQSVHSDEENFPWEDSFWKGVNSSYFLNEEKIAQLDGADDENTSPVGVKRRYGHSRIPTSSRSRANRVGDPPTHVVETPQEGSVSGEERVSEAETRATSHQATQTVPEPPQDVAPPPTENIADLVNPQPESSINCVESLVFGENGCGGALSFPSALEAPQANRFAGAFNVPLDQGGLNLDEFYFTNPEAGSFPSQMLCEHNDLLRYVTERESSVAGNAVTLHLGEAAVDAPGPVDAGAGASEGLSPSSSSGSSGSSSQSSDCNNHPLVNEETGLIVSTASFHDQGSVLIGDPSLYQNSSPGRKESIGNKESDSFDPAKWLNVIKDNPTVASIARDCTPSKLAQGSSSKSVALTRRSSRLRKPTKLFEPSSKEVEILVDLNAPGAVSTPMVSPALGVGLMTAPAPPQEKSEESSTLDVSASFSPCSCMEGPFYEDGLSVFENWSQNLTHPRTSYCKQSEKDYERLRENRMDEILGGLSSEISPSKEARTQELRAAVEEQREKRCFGKCSRALAKRGILPSSSVPPFLWAMEDDIGDSDASDDSSSSKEKSTEDVSELEKQIWKVKKELQLFKLKERLRKKLKRKKLSLSGYSRSTTSSRSPQKKKKPETPAQKRKWRGKPQSLQQLLQLECSVRLERLDSSSIQSLSAEHGFKVDSNSEALSSPKKHPVQSKSERRSKKDSAAVGERGPSTAAMLTPRRRSVKSQKSATSVQTQQDVASVPVVMVEQLEVSQAKNGRKSALRQRVRNIFLPDPSPCLPEDEAAQASRMEDGSTVPQESANVTRESRFDSSYATPSETYLVSSQEITTGKPANDTADSRSMRTRSMDSSVADPSLSEKSAFVDTEEMNDSNVIGDSHVEHAIPQDASCSSQEEASTPAMKPMTTARSSGSSKRKTRKSRNSGPTTAPLPGNKKQDSNSSFPQTTNAPELRSQDELPAAPNTDIPPTVKEPPQSQVLPTVEEPPSPEVLPTLEELPSSEILPIVEKPPSSEVLPTVEEPPRPEVLPTLEELPSSEILPIVEKPPSSEVLPTVGEPPRPEVLPIVEKLPSSEVLLTVEEPPSSEVLPTVEEPPSSEVLSTVEEPPISEVLPTVEEPPRPQVLSTVEEPLSSRVLSTVEEPPRSEVLPTVEELPEIGVHPSVKKNRVVQVSLVATNVEAIFSSALPEPEGIPSDSVAVETGANRPAEKSISENVNGSGPVSEELATPKKSHKSDRFGRLSLSCRTGRNKKQPKRSLSVDCQPSDKPLMTDGPNSSVHTKPSEDRTDKEAAMEENAIMIDSTSHTPLVTPVKKKSDDSSAKNSDRKSSSKAALRVTPLEKDLESFRMTPRVDRFADVHFELQNKLEEQLLEQCRSEEWPVESNSCPKQSSSTSKNPSASGVSSGRTIKADEKMDSLNAVIKSLTFDVPAKNKQRGRGRPRGTTKSESARGRGNSRRRGRSRLNPSLAPVMELLAPSGGLESDLLEGSVVTEEKGKGEVEEPIAAPTPLEGNLSEQLPVTQKLPASNGGLESDFMNGSAVAEKRSGKMKEPTAPPAPSEENQPEQVPVPQKLPASNGGLESNFMNGSAVAEKSTGKVKEPTASPAPLEENRLGPLGGSDKIPAVIEEPEVPSNPVKRSGRRSGRTLVEVDKTGSYVAPKRSGSKKERAAESANMNASAQYEVSLADPNNSVNVLAASSDEKGPIKVAGSSGQNETNTRSTRVRRRLGSTRRVLQPKTKAAMKELFGTDSSNSSVTESSESLLHVSLTKSSSEETGDSAVTVETNGGTEKAAGVPEVQPKGSMRQLNVLVENMSPGPSEQLSSISPDVINADIVATQKRSAETVSVSPAKRPRRSTPSLKFLEAIADKEVLINASPPKTNKKHSPVRLKPPRKAYANGKCEAVSGKKTNKKRSAEKSVASVEVPSGVDEQSKSAANQAKEEICKDVSLKEPIPSVVLVEAPSDVDRQSKFAANQEETSLDTKSREEESRDIESKPAKLQSSHSKKSNLKKASPVKEQLAAVTSEPGTSASNVNSLQRSFSTSETAGKKTTVAPSSVPAKGAKLKVSFSWGAMKSLAAVAQSSFMEEGELRKATGEGTVENPENSTSADVNVPSSFKTSENAIIVSDDDLLRPVMTGDISAAEIIDLCDTTGSPERPETGTTQPSGEEVLPKEPASNPEQSKQSAGEKQLSRSIKSGKATARSVKGPCPKCKHCTRGKSQKMQPSSESSDSDSSDSDDSTSGSTSSEASSSVSTTSEEHPQEKVPIDQDGKPMVVVKIGVGPASKTRKYQSTKPSSQAVKDPVQPKSAEETVSSTLSPEAVAVRPNLMSAPEVNSVVSSTTPKCPDSPVLQGSAKLNVRKRQLKNTKSARPSKRAKTNEASSGRDSTMLPLNSGNSTIGSSISREGSSTAQVMSSRKASPASGKSGMTSSPFAGRETSSQQKRKSSGKGKSPTKVSSSREKSPTKTSSQKKSSLRKKSPNNAPSQEKSFSKEKSTTKASSPKKSSLSEKSPAMASSLKKSSSIEKSPPMASSQKKSSSREKSPPMASSQKKSSSREKSPPMASSQKKSSAREKSPPMVSSPKRSSLRKKSPPMAPSQKTPSSSQKKVQSPRKKPKLAALTSSLEETVLKISSLGHCPAPIMFNNSPRGQPEEVSSDDQSNLKDYPVNTPVDNNSCEMENEDTSVRAKKKLEFSLLSESSFDFETDIDKNDMTLGLPLSPDEDALSQRSSVDMFEDTILETNLHEDSSQRSIPLIPILLPPSTAEVLASLSSLGIPETVNPTPYFSNYLDVKKKKEINGHILHLSSRNVVDLEEFQSSVVTFGIRDQQKVLCNLFLDEKNAEDLAKIASSLVSDRTVYITPLKHPPSVREVVLWTKAKSYLKAEKSPIKTKAVTKIFAPRSPGGSQGSDDSLDISQCSSIEITTPESTQSTQHSTPQSDSKKSSDLDSPLLKTTPILRPPKRLGVRRKPRRLSVEPSLAVIKEDSNESHESLPDSQDSSLRRLLLSSQFQNQVSPLGTNTSDISCLQIEGLDRSKDFRVPLENLQHVRNTSEHQFTTLLIMELHISVCGELRPDPERDPIRAVFYTIVNDVPPDSSLPRQFAGVIAVDSDDLLLSKIGVNANVTYTTDEVSLVRKVIEFVREWDPDIVAGYEIEMLSWGYLIDRANVLGVNMRSELSRIVTNEKPKQHKKPGIDSDEDVNFFGGLSLIGRIVIDVWRLMRHEVALQSYSFENIAYHILHQRMPVHSFASLSFWWDHSSHLYRWRTVQHYLNRVNGIARILDQLDFIGRTSELARLFGIQFFEVLSRGSQFRVESMMLRLAKPANFVPVSPSVQQRAHMKAPEMLPLIMEPESRFYSDPVIVLDFQSLYPSMIIAYNYCFSTCLGRVDHLGKSSHYEFGCCHLLVPPRRLKKLQTKLTVAPCGVAFVTPEVRRGILPQMLEEILEARLAVKDSMKRHRDNKTLQRVLHARQLGLKLIANVTYGYTSANFSGRMPCIEVGDSVVSKGRETLERAITMVHSNPDWRARVVYGDTDSLFVLVAGRSREEAFRIGAEIADAVTQDNPSPVKLKLEKVYQPCILQTKKRYVGYMYESPNQKEPVYDAKGIETVRRDGCPAVAKMLEKTLRILFETANVSLVKNYVCRQFTKMFKGRTNLQDFIYAKEYRGISNYRPGACVPALELARRWMAKDRRSEPRISERVPYVIVNGPPGLPLIHLVRSPRDLLADPSLRLNVVYYITRAIIPPLDRCFSLIGADILSWYTDLPRKKSYIYTSEEAGANARKNTISQYFCTVECVCCGQLTNRGICLDCRRRPQSVAVQLCEKLHSWEHAYITVNKVCQSCIGSPEDVNCISLDCPILYRRLQASREYDHSNFIRRLKDECLRLV